MGHERLEPALPGHDRVLHPRRCASSRTRRRARRGNRIGAVGMAIAIVVTFARARAARLLAGSSSAMAIGGAFGAVAARRVKMTAMPQMVALFNGVGGGAAALVSLAEFHHARAGAGRLCTATSRRDRALGADRLGLVRRLADRVREAPGADPRPADHLSRPAGRQRALCSRSSPRRAAPRSSRAPSAVAARDRARRRASLFGVLFVLPIGGADMPVVISLLNAFTGLAAAATGFELENNVLIVSGTLVGASGTLLTMMMGAGDEPLDRERPLRRVRPGPAPAPAAVARGERRACGRRPPTTSP